VGWLVRRTIPELDLCRSDFERREAHARAKTAPGVDPRLLAWMCLVASVGAVAWMMTTTSRPYWMDRSVALAIQIGILLLAVPAAWVSAWIAGDRHRRIVRKYLVERGVPVCLRSGYDLAAIAIDSTVCPECGHRLGERERTLIKRP